MRICPFNRCFALILGLVVLGASVGCIRSPEKIHASWGDILIVAASDVKKLDRVLYLDGEQSYVITPQEEGTTLALVKARVINPRSTKVTLSLDEDAAILQSTKGQFKPLYYAGRSVPTTEVLPKDYPYAPFLWGSIELIQGFEVTGWFIFEVPVGSKFTDFIWEDVESINVAYRR